MNDPFKIQRKKPCTCDTCFVEWKKFTSMAREEERRKSANIVSRAMDIFRRRAHDFHKDDDPVFLAMVELLVNIKTEILFNPPEHD